MADRPHILVVDDDERVRNLLCRYLEGEGFRVTLAADGAEMHRCTEENGFDLVLLDLMLPGEDGLSLARNLRQRSTVPIIMLTGKGDTIDRVVGLEMGADDYIPKPFHLREVLARIKTVLRRARPAEAEPKPTAKPGGGEQMLIDDLRLDIVRRELRSPTGSLVPVTSGEFTLLAAFARNANRVLSRDQLMDLTRGQDWTPFDRSIDAQVARLRKKIEQDPESPQLIKTIRGAGYMLAATVRRL